MSIDSAVGYVTDHMPPFNDYLLRGYTQETVDNFPEFMCTIFKEAVKLYKGDLKFVGARVLEPTERLDYVANNPIIKGKISIQQNEYYLMEFLFEYLGEPISVPMYIPYLYENAFIINGTRFYILHAIVERMICHVPDGVIIKVMRSPLQFWRNRTVSYEDTDGQPHEGIVVTMRAHFRRNRTSKKYMQTPLVLYLLARYDFDHVMNILGVPPNAIDFVSEVPTDRNPETDRYVYVKLNKALYLKLESEVIFANSEYNLHKRVAASLVDIYRMVKSADITVVRNITFYKSILGRNLYPSVNNNLLAADHANSHLDSLSTYLDQYTKLALESINIRCNDIFDLFVNVFVMIDEWSAWHSVNDLFTKRIGGTESLLIEVVKQIFNRFYDAQRKNKVIKPQSIKSMLRIPSLCIPNQCIRVASIRSSNDMYNDNDLLSVYAKKIRQSSSQSRSKNTNSINDKEHKYHPSFIVIESPLALSQSSPGVSGDVNPYAQIDSRGNFREDRMPWYREIHDILSKYLGIV